MPKKPGRGRGRNMQQPPRRENPERRHYFDHDDRSGHEDGGSRPRVSFKTSRVGKGGRDREGARDIGRGGRGGAYLADMRTALRLHLEDDVDMSNDSNFRRIRFRGGNTGFGVRSGRGGRNSPLPQRGGGGQRPGQRRLNPASGTWFKVTILYGSKYQKDFILQNLMTHIAPDTFLPIMYKVEGHDVNFYVDEFKAADKLMSCDRKIVCPEGFKLSVRVRPGFPQVEVDGVLKDRIKASMAKRYLASTNALDLSQFHRDPDLCTDSFCALSRPMVLLAVLDIIGEHTPQLGALNLDSNNLQTLERLGALLPQKLPNLKILYIGDNRIREMKEIDTLKGLKLEELRLAGNPCCDKYKDRHEDYVSDVRKRFPRLLKLDGVELAAPIVFDVVDENDGAKLPPSRRAFALNEDARQIAATFLHQYFTIYDGDNRQPLLDAYDEQASFSLTLAIPPNGSNRFARYLPENRNLFRVNDRERRQKLLKQGRLLVVSLISEIPKTRHYLESFTMDLGLVTETMMVVTVTGLFQELINNGKGTLRYFSRTLVIVPQGAGYCVRNEQLHIGDPTQAQEKQIEAWNRTASVNATPKVMPSQDNSHEEMTVALAQQSGMNLEWSRKCLGEVNWNFEAGLAAFRQYHALGQVPAEAFSKT